MSTRSIIAFNNGSIHNEGIFPATTAHYDGGPANMLPKLLEHFTDPHITYELCDQAPFSSLENDGTITRNNSGFYAGKDDFPNLEEAAEYFFDTEFAYLYEWTTKSWTTYKINRTKIGEDWTATIEKMGDSPEEILIAEYTRIRDLFQKSLTPETDIRFEKYYKEQIKYYDDLLAKFK